VVECNEYAMSRGLIPLDREYAPSVMTHEEETPGIDATGSPGHTPTHWVSVLREIVQTLLLALLLALVLRFFFVDTYMIDGPSMEPALHQGERLLVSKMTYRIRRPLPGEIVVFEEPGSDGRSLIKRVVAVEGQTLEIRQGRVILDGDELEESYIENPGRDSLPPQRIPAGAVFVLGDNRANSWDSRYFGMVPTRHIHGMAVLVFWPPDSFHRVAGQPAGGWVRTVPGQAMLVHP